MAGLLDAILGMSGQERTAALRQLGRDAEYYIPPELRGILGFLAEMTPTASLERASQASSEMLAPDRTAMERLGSAGQMLSETAGVAAPMMVAGRAAMPAAQAVQEGLLGFSMAADDVGRRVIDRLNQPGPVPTMYSNPVMAPFDIGRGSTAEMPIRERSGEEIIKSLAEQPSAKSALGAEGEPIGAGFTNVTSLKPNVLAEHRNVIMDTGERLDPKPQTISGLLGRDVLSIVGDNTGRHDVLQVNDTVFENPVRSLAGFQYTDVPGQGYAGASSATSSKYNEAKKSKDPYYLSVLMGDQSGDFALHTGQIFGEMFKGAKISQKDAPKINEAIKKIGVPKTVKVYDDNGNVVKKPDGSAKSKSITTYPFQDFPGVENTNSILDYINNMPTGTMRAYFLKGLDKDGLQKMGVPRVADARLAAADTSQLGMDWGTVGYRGFTPDLEKGPHPTRPDQSTTYDTGIDKIGQSETLLQNSRGIPANLLFRDMAEKQREKGTGGGLLMNSADYKVLEMSPSKAKQRIDEMAVETIDTFLEIENRFGREAALKYAGQLLSGGRITSDLIQAARKANAPTWILAALAPSYSLLSQPDQELQ